MSNTENEVCVWPNVDTHDQWKWKSQWTIKLPSLVLWIYTTFHVFIFTDIWCLHLWSFLIHCHNLLSWMDISSCRGLHFTAPCVIVTCTHCTSAHPSHLFDVIGCGDELMMVCVHCCWWSLCAFLPSALGTWQVLPGTEWGGSHSSATEPHWWQC